MTFTSAEEKHLGWTSNQGYILTGGGRAEELYCAERGFSFREDELPHHFLLRGETLEVFKKWAKTSVAESVCGVWNRTLFIGGFNHTTDHDETVYNVQTRNLFIDLRIPKSRQNVLQCDNVSSVRELTPHQLRLYARQHVFAGFSFLDHENDKPVCARHHCIDWNFVGSPRTRPNKWWIRMNDDKSVWKELSYATDEDGQHYYFEHWQRYEGGEDTPRLAMRKRSPSARDGIIVAVGDHFNYVLGRIYKGGEKKYSQGTLVGVVDAAVAAGDLETAYSYLSIQGGHGRISKGWFLDCAIEPWKEGTKLWEPKDIGLVGSSIDNCCVEWNGEEWDVLDCSFTTTKDLKEFLKNDAVNDS